MYHISVQRAVSPISVPSTVQLKNWVKSALKNQLPSAELTIRIVDKEEMTFLNSTYRHKNKPTNVLSFPSELPEELKIDVPILGDIVICAEVIEEEAKEQHKQTNAHWAHMVVHGVLHLLGYDHEIDQDAEKMEAEEIIILKSLGFSDPYQIVEKGE